MGLRVKAVDGAGIVLGMPNRIEALRNRVARYRSYRIDLKQ